MLRKFQNIVSFLFVTLSITGCSYTKDLTVLSRKQAIYDLDYLVKNVKAIHPNPFTSITEEGFDSHAEQIKTNLGDKTSRKDFSFLIAELFALIQDSHTGLDITPDCWDFFHKGGKLFPLGLYHRDSGAGHKPFLFCVQH